MNLIETYYAGQRGESKGLPMGDGLVELDRTINGIQKARIYGVAAGSKVGKSTLVDNAFVIEPAIHSIAFNAQLQAQINPILEKLKTTTNPSEREALNGQFAYLENQKLHLEFIYFSYEIDRVSKEFDFVAHFLNRDYGITHIQLEEGITVKGEKVIELSSDYLMGQIQDDNRNLIQVKETIFEKIKIIHKERIIPLFGDYDVHGNQITPGLIIFQEHKENPTGIRNWLIAYAERNGTFNYKESKDKEGVTHKRWSGYTPQNPKKFVIIVTDHLRKIPSERHFNAKQTVDKFSEYAVEFRNTCKFSFIHIIHLNRGMSDINRMKYLDDRLYPTADDIKDTGNLSEDVNYLITMFDPNDDKYALKKHFGRVIKDTKDNTLYPYLRTIHLVESRHCPFPQHFAVNMYGGYKKFEKFVQP